MKIKLVYWIFLVFLLLYLNYFYCIFLVTKGELFSVKYQLFLQFIFFFVFFSTTFFKYRIKLKFLLFLVFAFPSFISSFFYIGIVESAFYLTNTLLLPILFISIVSTQFLDCNSVDKHLIFKLFIYYFLLRSVTYIILIPLELSSSDKEGFHNLQFTGGQYHNVGIMFLLSVIVNYLHRIDNYIYKKERIITFILLFVTVLLSFSRVGIILFLIYISFNFVNINFKKVLYLLSFGLILYTSFHFFNLEDNLFITFWQNRLNIDLGDVNTFKISNIFNQENGDDVRGVIRDIGFQRNVFEFVIGTGIGTTVEYLFQNSNGLYRFSSFHNFFLTILFERGIFSFFLVIMYFMWLIFNFLRLHLLRSNIFFTFLLFIFFIISTGAELFLNSRDFNIDMVLCLLFFEVVLINTYRLNGRIFIK